MTRTFLTGVSACLVAAACTDPSSSAGPPLTTDVIVHTVDWYGRPLADVPVFVHDAAGALVDETVSDGNGKVSLPVPAGGSVTAREAKPSGPSPVLSGEWVTVLGVELGDELELQFRPRDWPAAPPARELQVTVPPMPPAGGSFTASTPCGGSTDFGYHTSTLVESDPACPARGPLVVTAINAAGVVGYLEQADAELAGSFTFAGPWRPPANSFRFKVTGLTPEAQLSAWRASRFDGFAFDGIPIELDQVSTAAAYQGSRSTWDEGAAYGLHLHGDPGECGSQDRSYQRVRAGDQDDFVVDASELSPPIDGLALHDHEITWTGGGPADARAVYVEYAARLTDVEQQHTQRTWAVLAPPGTTAIALPADVGFQWPAPGDSEDEHDHTAVTEIASTYWLSYAAVRADVAALRPGGDSLPRRTLGEYVHRTSMFYRLHSICD
jgi:hypothetical protein